MGTSRILNILSCIAAALCLLSLSASGILCIIYGIGTSSGTILGAGIVQVCLLFLMTLIIFLCIDADKRD